jgi:hypothetical protein
MDMVVRRDAEKQQRQHDSPGTGGMTAKMTALFDAAKAVIDAFVAAPEAPIEGVLAGDFGTHIAKAA